LNRSIREPSRKEAAVARSKAYSSLPIMASYDVTNNHLGGYQFTSGIIMPHHLWDWLLVRTVTEFHCG
jgi:hypothetical protein